MIMTCVSWQDQHLSPCVATFHYAAQPSAEHPHGLKGAILADLWRDLADSGINGMATKDGDVAADPSDLALLQAAAARQPEAVHTGQLKLWPRSSGHPDWIYGHQVRSGTEISWTRDRVTSAEQCGTGFAWWPAAVLDKCAEELAGTAYPGVDQLLSRTARDLGLPIRVISACQPRHLNF